MAKLTTQTMVDCLHKFEKSGSWSVMAKLTTQTMVDYLHKFEKSGSWSVMAKLTTQTMVDYLHKFEKSGSWSAIAKFFFCSPNAPQATDLWRCAPIRWGKSSRSRRLILSETGRLRGSGG